ncbi:radical SAM family heme chaperone HemW [Helicobacter sp. 13S00477-4]|uniref:radical SAM family heme chaperone HemW n=1 Tax=Helicobacter sp. 13S00477-4 TaxID=1905759 RepID=UPI000BA6E8CF|nr:radical SAM family heme chaperone HemW [Helicobacter sp. 13S00477-4]PAF52643.1 coproporphyrinogen III oxidase [Helicobacter sp. 13S00477-4]
MILYIHIPFCNNKCGYCTFNSYANEDSLKKAYMEALYEDIKYFLSENNEIIKSIFFGGGTPNSIPSKDYEKIFEYLNTSGKIQKNCEITAEVNPDLVTLEWCKDMKNFGVNRISMGVQSFYEDKLIFLQREHNIKNIFSSIDIIHKSGFGNISIDLIYDTPKDNKKRIFEEIRKASELPINHLSAYSLSIENHSALQKIYGKNPQTYSFFKEIREALKYYQFNQYEVSSYSRGYKVEHNLSYWDSEEYIGCGAGAVGKIAKNRFYAISNISSYIQNPLKRKVEVLKKNDIRIESIFLGLRCEIGVETKLLDNNKVKILIDENKCHLKGSRLVANDYFLADEIALWLM